MNQTVLVALAVALVFLVWAWIGVSILRRLSLEQQVEKLESIENRHPEEERQLARLDELRSVERKRVGKAKLLLLLLAALLLASLALVGMDNAQLPLFGQVLDLQLIFGADNVKLYTWAAVVILAFLVLPTYVGLSLATVGRPRRPRKP